MLLALRTTPELATLPDTFTVFHDAAVTDSNANVDHVVVGPQGLIIVDTKVRGGRNVRCLWGQVRWLSPRVRRR